MKLLESVGVYHYHPIIFYYRIKHRAFKLINTRLEIAMKSIHNEMVAYMEKEECSLN